MNIAQILLRFLLLILGIIQVLTNFLYLIKKNGIYLARKQHKELPKDVSDRQMRIKVFCMFLFGILLCAASLTQFLPTPLYLLSMMLTLTLFFLYAMIEAFFYRYLNTFGFTAVTLILLIIFAFSELDGFAVYKENFMEATSSPSTIYQGETKGIIYSPFQFKVDQMEWLMPLNIDNDPDEIYEGFEPQTFNDEAAGKGLRVLAYRKDGFVDVYYQPSLKCDATKFSQVGKGLNKLAERPMEDMRYAVTPEGLEFYCSFEDIKGRNITIKVKENDKRSSKPSNLLAPLGSDASKPDVMPVYILHDFRLVKIKNSEVSVRIAGKEHQVDKLPILMDWEKVYLMRYSSDLTLLDWNPAVKDEVLKPLKADDKMQIQNQNTQYDLIDNQGHYEIKTMSILKGKHKLSVYFKPAFPELTSLKEGAAIQGEFTLAEDKTTGTISGVYEVSKQGDKINIKVHPSKGWKPNESNWAMKLLYAMVPMFKEWPKTYIWTAEMILNEKGQLIMNSQWNRTTQAVK